MSVLYLQSHLFIMSQFNAQGAIQKGNQGENAVTSDTGLGNLLETSDSLSY